MPRAHTFVPSDYSAIRLEPLDQVANIRADLIRAYQPVNSEELFAIERLALARAALLRVYRLESGLYSSFFNACFTPGGIPIRLMQPETLNDNFEITVQQNRNFLISEGMSRFDARSKDLVLFLRFQAQTERLYRRAIEELHRVRKLRNVLPSEPLDDPAPTLPEFEPPPFNPFAPTPQPPSTVEPAPGTAPAPASAKPGRGPSRRSPAAAAPNSVTVQKQNATHRTHLDLDRVPSCRPTHPLEIRRLGRLAQLRRHRDARHRGRSPARFRRVLLALG